MNTEHDAHSPARRLDARAKLILALGLLIGINLTPAQAWPAYLGYGLCLGLVILLARLSPRQVLARSLLALPFVLLAAAGAPFTREGTPLWSGHLGGWRLTLTDVGLWRVGALLVRSWLSLGVAILLGLTTPFAELAQALGSLGVPQVLTATMLLMYRYLRVLVEEARRLLRAREARSGELAPGRGGGRLTWRARVTGQMIGTLFLRTYERSERIYQAMLARGFDGHIRTLRRPRFAYRDGLVLGAGLALMALLTGFAHLAW